MKSLLFLIPLILMGCASDVDIVTEIPSDMDGWMVKEMLKPCDDPTKAEIKTELVEHNHFKCTQGWNEGLYKCWGWYVQATATCTSKGVKITTESRPMSFGNMEIKSVRPHKELQ
jgi:hypothetical protein